MIFSGIIMACSSNSHSSDDIDIEPEIIPQIPHFSIHTEGGAAITSKEDYVDGSLMIEGFEAYQDMESSIGIRGRGNTTWTHYPKKPYKIKLENKEPLMGLHAYKNWILLAEYLDGSLLYNSVPFKMGELLEMPFTNHIIPVELTLNDEYQGVYAFTEHKEVKEHRINLGEEGILLEMDAYFDEDLQFKSAHYELPVMIKYPKYKDLNPWEAEELLQEVQTDFNHLEELIYDESFPNNNYLEYFDDVEFVNYMMVYQLTLNREINHPKSTYLHKPKNGKYKMGIIWDFDWGFGFSENGQHYAMNTVETPLFVSGNIPGKNFFSRIMEDPHMKNLFKERWNWFRSEHYAALKDHIKRYAAQVKQAYEKDHEVWGMRNASGDPDQDLQNLLNWLDARAQYIDQKTMNW